MWIESPVRGQRVMIVTLAGLMNNADPGGLPMQFRQTANHCSLIACAPWLPANKGRVGVPPRFGRNFKERLPHRNSSYFRVTKIFRGLRKDDRAPETNRATARLANPDNVRLKGKRRNVLHYCRQHRRTGSVSAHADYDVGSKFVQDAGRAPTQPAANRRPSWRESSD